VPGLSTPPAGEFSNSVNHGATVLLRVTVGATAMAARVTVVQRLGRCRLPTWADDAVPKPT
jgi:hypothetical protein